MNEVLASTAVAVVSGLAVPVLFTVPGFLLHSAYMRGLRSPETHDRVFLARTVVGSLIVHSLALPWTFRLVEAAREGTSSPWEFAAWALVVLVAGPVLVGSVAATAVKARRPRWAAAVLDYTALAHHIRTPDAWQWHFSRRRPDFVRVHLKDQRVVLGYLGSRSFAASDPSRRDLFLERQFMPGAGKVYGPPVPSSDGVWINGDEIAFVEFHGAGERDRGEVENEEASDDE
ncbi:DUF6338 family protein [Glycomyces sp. A-F 0318]|uniref:DUF6338 family protein n=1 Tax=Glycomyces amatae TaxID=2881355 RepID=UPI001E411580|nr:DUF6338 family protein [Glycomyces amatae]